MKRAAFLLALGVLAAVIFAFAIKPKAMATPETGGIKWMTWSQLQEAEKKEHKKVYVDVYTGWCGWCKRMEATTFTNPVVVKYINDNFYAVRFDAETREEISFKGHNYKYVAQGAQGYNELAAEILYNQMSYPTSVYFDENLDEIFPVPGYMDAKTFEAVINYVQSNSYKSTKFDEYQKSFSGKVK